MSSEEDILAFWAGTDELPNQGFLGELAEQAAANSEDLIEVPLATWLDHIEKMLSWETLIPALASDGKKWWYVGAFSDWYESKLATKPEDPSEEVWVEGRYINSIRIACPDDIIPSIYLKKTKPFNPPHPEDESHTAHFRATYGRVFYNSFKESEDLLSVIRSVKKFYIYDRPMTFRIFSKQKSETAEVLE